MNSLSKVFAAQNHQAVAFAWDSVDFNAWITERDKSVSQKWSSALLQDAFSAKPANPFSGLGGQKVVPSLQPQHTVLTVNTCKHYYTIL